MEKWPSLGRLCTGQLGFPIGCGESGRGPPGLGFFKQTFHLDCLLLCRIAALEPDKGESEGQTFLPEAKVTNQVLTAGLHENNICCLKKQELEGISRGQGSILELSKVYFRLKLSDLCIQVKTDQHGRRNSLYTLYRSAQLVFISVRSLTHTHTQAYNVFL